MAAAQGCGVDGALRPHASLLRFPYLQSVTATAAVVAFATDTSAPAWAAVEGGPRAASAPPLPIVVGGRTRYLHAPRLEGLAPATRYCYRVGQGDTAFVAGLALSTAPAVTAATIRFDVLGDFGAGTRAQLRLRKVLAENPAPLLITTGDNAYPDGTHDEFERYVFDVYRGLWAQTAVYPSPGNHDYRTELAAPYLANFVLPENVTRPADRERYYSFDWGPVHFVALDSEIPQIDAMLAWLEADLKAARRPWVVAYFHKPPYSASRHSGNARMREQVVPILERHGVRLVLNGHNHSYERFKPLRGGAPVAEGAGTVYVTTGGGGAIGYGIDAVPLLATGSEAHHYVRAEADACEIRLRAVSDAGAELDRYTLRRCQ